MSVADTLTFNVMIRLLCVELTTKKCIQAFSIKMRSLGLIISMRINYFIVYSVYRKCLRFFFFLILFVLSINHYIFHLRLSQK